MRKLSRSRRIGQWSSIDMIRIPIQMHERQAIESRQALRVVTARHIIQYRRREKIPVALQALRFGKYESAAELPCGLLVVTLHWLTNGR